MTRNEFIQFVAVVARKDWLNRRIMLPSVVIAQALKESAVGKSELAVNANALFGIKLNDWTGKSYTKKADEQNADGSMRVDPNCLWRAYENWEESIIDHNTYIAERKVGKQVNPNFKNVIGETNVKKVIAGLIGNDNRLEVAERCTDSELKEYVLQGTTEYGYATGLNYAQSLLDDYILKYNLTKYDVIEEVEPMNKKILFVLDPGHYPNYNRGAVPGYFEGDKMYDFTEYERDALKAYGVDVIITRGRSNDMPLYNRGQVAVKNGKGYDVVVFKSNHSNGFNGQACGVEAYISVMLPETRALAEKVIDAVVDVMKPATGVTYDRGVKTRQGNSGDYYGVLRGSVSGALTEAQAKKGPVTYSFIIEHGFHDNVKECTFLNNSSNLKKMAQAEAKAMVEFLGLSKGSEETKTEVKEETKKEEGIKVEVSTLQKGAKGSEVKALQALLIGYGYSCGNAGADGDFGSGTLKAVKAYQKANKLTVDGIVGKNTWTKLLGLS